MASATPDKEEGAKSSPEVNEEEQQVGALCKVWWIASLLCTSSLGPCPAASLEVEVMSQPQVTLRGQQGAFQLAE